MTKKEIRNIMLIKRNNLNKTDHKIKNEKIISQIRLDKRYIAANNIAIFYPFGAEINLLPLTTDNKNFYIPKVEKDGIHFYKYDKNIRLVKSKFGIPEPISGDRFDNQIELMIVPALAISKANYRIGYGGGHYDRFLSKNNIKHKIGVIFDFQELDYLPHEDFDQKLDGYIKG